MHYEHQHWRGRYPAMIISLEVSARVMLKVKPEKEATEHANFILVLYITEVCRMAVILKDEKSEILTSPERILTVSTESDCSGTFKTVGKHAARFSVKSDGVLVPAFLSDDTSHRAMSAILRACFVHFCHFSLLVGRSEKRCM